MARKWQNGRARCPKHHCSHVRPENWWWIWIQGIDFVFKEHCVEKDPCRFAFQAYYGRCTTQRFILHGHSMHWSVLDSWRHGAAPITRIVACQDFQDLISNPSWSPFMQKLHKFALLATQLFVFAVGMEANLQFFWVLFLVVLLQACFFVILRDDCAKTIQWRQNRTPGRKCLADIVQIGDGC